MCVSLISYLPCSETCRWPPVKQEWMHISGMNSSAAVSVFAESRLKRQGVAGSKFCSESFVTLVVLTLLLPSDTKMIQWKSLAWSHLRLSTILFATCFRKFPSVGSDFLKVGKKKTIPWIIINLIAAFKMLLGSHPVRKTPLARYSMSLVVAVRLNALDPSLRLEKSIRGNWGGTDGFQAVIL